MPPEVWQGENYRPEAIRTFPTEILSTDNLWAMRLDTPDTSVPARRWITECILRRSENRVGEEVAFCQIRLTCATLETQIDIQPAVPRCVRSIAESPGLRVDGEWQLARTSPHHLTAENELDDLYDLLADSGRRRDVIMLASGDDTTPQAVNGVRLTRRLCGLAHVFLVPEDLRSMIGEYLGTPWRIPYAGARTFRPGFAVDDDPPSHPWASAARIEHWPSTRREPFEIHLAREAAITGVRQTPRGEVYYFSAARAEVDEASAAAAADDDQLAQARAEVTRLRNKYAALEDEHHQMLELAQQDELRRQEAERERGELRTERHQLSARVSWLEHQLAQRPDQPHWQDIEVPGSLAEIADWAEQNLAGRVYIENRAIRETEKSPYNEPERVYRALLLLAYPYIEMRNGERNRESFVGLTKEVGVDWAPTGAGGASGQYGARYFVYRHGQHHYLDEHLTKGTTKDDSENLRIYFLWDEDDQIVVVGWMPSHLPNRYT